MLIPGFARYWKGIDHIYMLVEIPPKYAVSTVVGFKGKSVITKTRTYLGKWKNFTGQYFWARGYFVSAVDRDEKLSKNKVRGQTA
jgi:putative transposase